MRAQNKKRDTERARRTIWWLQARETETERRDPKRETDNKKWRGSWSCCSPDDPRLPSVVSVLRSVGRSCESNPTLFLDEERFGSRPSFTLLLNYYRAPGWQLWCRSRDLRQKRAVGQGKSGTSGGQIYLEKKKRKRTGRKPGQTHCYKAGAGQAQPARLGCIRIENKQKEKGSLSSAAVPSLHREKKTEFVCARGSTAELKTAATAVLILLRTQRAAKSIRPRHELLSLST